LSKELIFQDLAPNPPKNDLSVNNNKDLTLYSPILLSLDKLQKPPIFLWSYILILA